MKDPAANVPGVKLVRISKLGSLPFRLDREKDLDVLVKHIEENGLLVPIIIDKKTRAVIYGGRRVAAFQRLGRKTIPAVYQ